MATDEEQMPFVKQLAAGGKIAVSLSSLRKGIGSLVILLPYSC